MSTGAATALLNRLESAAHITRAREHTDRRTVTPRGEHIQKRADDIFATLARRHAATPPRRHAATPPRRHAATPPRRHAATPP
ncbi:hypothetical protein ACFVDN_30845, partial [Streptomyces californicus]